MKYEKRAEGCPQISANGREFLTQNTSVSVLSRVFACARY